MVGVELSLSETEDIVDVLIFLHEETSPADRLRLNEAMVTMLRLASDRLRRVSTKLGAWAPAFVVMATNVS
ncbi:hypothetical protein MCHK_3037 [Mesorhizobium huakuii 7653R]|nr:hypothetical protein MCHK_3037 [Mesorhizobium huakuii 7653R]